MGILGSSRLLRRAFGGDAGRMRVSSALSSGRQEPQLEPALSTAPMASSSCSPRAMAPTMVLTPTSKQAQTMAPRSSCAAPGRPASSIGGGVGLEGGDDVGAGDLDRLGGGEERGDDAAVLDERDAGGPRARSSTTTTSAVGGGEEAAGRAPPSRRGAAASASSARQPKGGRATAQ